MFSEIMHNLFGCARSRDTINLDNSQQRINLENPQQRKNRQHAIQDVDRSNYYDKNLIKTPKTSIPLVGIYSVFKDTIRKCKRDDFITMQIIDKNKIGEGSQAKIYQYDQHILKVPNQCFSLTSLQDIVSEFDLMRQYSEDDPDLFISDVQCYFELHQNIPYFIIQLPYLGNNLAFQENLQISGGEKIFQIEGLQDNTQKRFEIYLQLFKQLKHFYDDVNVHSDIKPENIMSNYPFDDFIKKKRSIEDLKLYIIDYGLMEDEDSFTYSGTFNFMHPQYYSKKVQEKKHKSDVYQLCLTLLIIETYQFGMSDDFIFELSSNIKQKQIIEEIEKTKLLNLKKKQQIYTETLMTYRQFFVDQFMQQDFQIDFMEQYQNYNRSLFGQYVKKYCQNNFHCILIMCLSDQIQDIPSVPTILELLELMLGQKNQNMLI